MTRTSVKACAAIIGMLSTANCNLPPMISDTGFKGTWSRGNDRNVSIVAITEVGGRWLFRWTKRSFDGKFAIVCDWEGHCEERLNGALVATYEIATRYDEAEQKLYTDTVEARELPVKQTFRYTDVMNVADHGHTLWNYTVQRDGQQFAEGARPMRSFVKVADGIAEPPRPQ